MEDRSAVIKRNAKEIRRWLAEEPSTTELAAAFPEEWREIERDIGRLLARDNAQGVTAYVASLTARPRPRRSRKQDALTEEIRRHLAVALLRQVRMSVATGVTEGVVRFNLVNGWVAQRLLFARGLERKPVSMRAFRLAWPVLWQRRRLMPLVERRGIYCFYSKPLVDRLAAIIGPRTCLEIGAGDGTLARFLAAAGVDVIATDDHSWNRSISYPEWVERVDARTALRRHRPTVVLCSWPPPGNAFEREVFKTPSVELYVVIGAAAEHNAGNWSDYRSQEAFDVAEDPTLSALVLPPEIKPAVYVFRRRHER